jgi:tRNA 2-selenouridine synthase
VSTTAQRFRVPLARAADVLERGCAVRIDLRSPAEYEEDHLPGAVNVPLFDDVERALIGTLYVRTSPERAFDAGRDLARAKIEPFTRAFARCAGWEVPDVDLGERLERWTAGGIARLERELEPRPLAALPEGAVVCYCWRGGLRSRSVVAFLRDLGLERAVGLAGGYRAYRALVRERLAGWTAPESFVLRGLTGVGKTLVLRALEEIRPGWTIDLEALAGHRSSILGMVGLEPVSQKRFDSRLAARLARGFPRSGASALGPCVLEGESRKVGDVLLPESVWRAIDAGTALELTASLERRIQVLLEDYLASPSSRAELSRRLPFIEERLGRRRWKGELVRLLDAGREAELAEILLERYYDPLYRHSEKDRRYAASFDARDPEGAALAIAAWIERAALIRGGRPGL